MSNAADNLMIAGELVEQDADFLRRFGHQQRNFLERIIVEPSGEHDLKQKVVHLVEKLARGGAMTKRGIVRCFHNQNYATIQSILEYGLKGGNIIQAGDLFHVPAVSVSASA